MAFARSESGREADESDYDEDDWPGVAKVEVAAAHFRQKEKHADGDNYDGAHEAADGATLAHTTNAIAHLSQTSRRSLLGTAVDAVPKHENAHGD